MMTDDKKTKDEINTAEDWAILPFDEKEDDERWARLAGEMDELEKKVASHEAIFGTILMEENLSQFQIEEARPKTEDEEMADYELF